MAPAPRERSTARSFLLALALLGTGKGCAARTARPPAPPLSRAEASRLLAGTAAAAAGVRRYQAVLGVRGEGRRGRFSGRLLVVFERPEGAEDPAAVAALRMELYSPVGGSRWTLVAEPGQVRVVVPGERAFAEGTELRQFTEPLLGVSVGLRQVAALLVGTGVPIGPGVAALPGPDGGAAVLDGGDRIWWDGAEGDAVQVRRVAAAGYKARYPDDYRRKGRQVPRTVDIESDRVRATLRVEELEVNSRLHSDSFRLTTPAGFRRAEVRELSGAMRLPER